MNDILLEAAIKLKELLQYKYLIRLMKSGRIRDIDLRFDQKSFYHLAGLHYVNHTPKLKNKSQVLVFQEILAGQIVFADLTDTTGLRTDEAQKLLTDFAEKDLTGRITHLRHLDRYLDQARLFYDYDYSKFRFDTEIKAAHSIVKLVSEQQAQQFVFAFFVASAGNQDHLLSFFPQNHRDYTLSQTFYYLRAMAKIKIKDETGNVLSKNQQLISSEFYHPVVSEEEKREFLR